MTAPDPQAVIAEVVGVHPWHVHENPDGSRNGVCLGCFETGVLPRFDTWADFSAHLTAVLAADSRVAIAGGPVIDVQHLTHQRDWSRETFGPGARLAGVLDHIGKELDEVEAKPDDITEWADLLILAFDGALRQGHEPHDIIAAIKAKQAKNETRTWLDWRTADPDKAIEHVRAAGGES